MYIKEFNFLGKFYRCNKIRISENMEKKSIFKFFLKRHILCKVFCFTKYLDLISAFLVSRVTSLKRM